MGEKSNTEQHNAKALQNYREAIRLNSANSLTYLRMGNLYYNADNFTDALPFYQKNSVCPKLENAIVCLGILI